MPLVGFTDDRRAAYGNQDRIAVAYAAGRGESSWLLAIVCDGVGGSSHGERAASTAAASVALEVARSDTRKELAKVLGTALSRAHSQTANRFQSKSSTTAVALLVSHADAVVGWVGDSRAYLLSGGKAALLTTDDTLAAAAARANPDLGIELNEEYGERLAQAIGGTNPVSPNILAWKSAEPDAMCMLCTDGVWKPTEAALDSLVGACQDVPELARRLMFVSDWMGGTDNASALLVPSVARLRDFLAHAASPTPEGFLSLHLPGPSHVLIPSQEAAAGQRVREDVPDKQANLPGFTQTTPPTKEPPAKRKANSSKKVDVKPKNRRLSNQLVIAEEPLDEGQTNSTTKIPGD